MTPDDLPQRFTRRISISPETGCWLYDGAQNNGYCQVYWNGGRPFIHRLAYELLVGPIPEGLDVDHVKARGCRHRNCCNPAHLEPVTSRENTMRGDTFAAANAAKTHCPRGHLYDEGNTRIYRGRRHCRACDRERYEYQGNPLPGDRTHCPQGHPYDNENTYVAPSGKRKCRVCNRKWAREAQQRRRDRMRAGH